MIVTRKSPFSGKVNEMDLPLSKDQMARYNSGNELIQNVFPNLNADEREFIMTGITPTEWNETFGGEE